MKKYRIGDQVKIVDPREIYWGWRDGKTYSEYYKLDAPKDYNAIIKGVGESGYSLEAMPGEELPAGSKHAWWSDRQLRLVYRPEYK